MTTQAKKTDVQILIDEVIHLQRVIDQQIVEIAALKSNLSL